MPQPVMNTLLSPSARTVALLLTGLAGLGSGAASLRAQDVLVRAARIVVAPDTVLTDGALLVRAGKVAFVGDEIPAETRANATLADYGYATLVPGFVLAQSTLGRDADLTETALPFTPDLRAVEAFDPWQEELLELPSFGITSVGLSPSARNVAGGIAALVKPGEERGVVATPETFVSLSLSREARNPERPPTSLMGARELLREAFATAQAGIALGPDTAILRQALAGSRRVFVHADTAAELLATLALAEQHQLQPVIVGGRELEKVLDRAVLRGVGVVLDTLRPEARLAALRLPAVLARAGVPFCFAGRPAQLRLSAALALRHGLDRETALRALTRTPAMLLGQDERVGSLRQGHAADFVVFDGDPLDLTSRHLATWVDGVRVFGEQPSRTRTNRTTEIAGER